MRPVTRTLLAAVSIAVTLTGLAAPAAGAQSAATWTVSPGGKFTASAFTKFTFLTDTVTGVRFKCGGFYVKGHLTSGAGLPPKIGEITQFSTAARPCTGDGLDFSLANDTSMPVRALKYHPGEGITHGVIPDVDLLITSLITGSTCTANLTGLLRWHHQNDTLSLTITFPATLAASNVTGCAGAINDGDTFTNSSRFTLSRDVMITSP
jgi:hypothetical protein